MKCRKDRLGCIGRKGQALSHRNVSHQERQGYGATEPLQEHRAEAEGARPRQLAAGCWVLGAGFPVLRGTWPCLQSSLFSRFRVRRLAVDFAPRLSFLFSETGSVSLVVILT